MNDSPMVLAFADELNAHRFLEALLWPNGAICPRCHVPGRVGRLDGGSTRIGAHKCYACRKIFSITYGTVFDRSHVPLHKWLQALYLTDNANRTVRPYHLARIINVSCKTATSMLRRLATARARTQDECAEPANRGRERVRLRRLGYPAL